MPHESHTAPDLIDAPAFIELTPAQTVFLMKAYAAHQNGDTGAREAALGSAITMGVPAAQAGRFVLWAERNTRGVHPNNLRDLEQARGMRIHGGGAS